MKAKLGRDLLADFVRLGKLWPYLKPHKQLIFLSGAMIPLIAVCQTMQPLVLKRAIDDGILKQDFQLILKAAMAYLGLAILSYLFVAGQAIFAARSVHSMIRSMRKGLVNHLFRLNCRYHDRSMSGALVTRATSDFDNLSESLNQGVLTSVVDVVGLIGTIIGMFLLDSSLALICLVVLPLVSLLVLFFSKILKRAMLEARAKLAKLNAFAQECLYGSPTVKALAAESAVEKKFYRYNREYRNSQMKSVVIDASLFSILDGISSITLGLVLWACLAFVDQSTTLTAGVVVAFVQFIQRLFEPLKQLTSKIAMLQGAFTAIDRIFGVFDTKEFIGGEMPVESGFRSLRFEKVNYSYGVGGDAEGDLVLKEVSFALERGKTLAIVGATGSGKSTIIKLLIKLYEGYRGDIYYGGQEVRSLDEMDLRKHISIVPQEVVLFDGTVEFNIGLEQPGVSEKDVLAAAELVGADSFIKDLKHGYKTHVNEDGTNLSAGQRQLIVFARALARKPDLVILDEATASIDPHSEKLIQNAIDQLLDNQTMIVIAHRLSTIVNCDSILVMDSGSVIEQGNHAELLKLKGHYYQLTNSLTA